MPSFLARGVPEYPAMGKSLDLGDSLRSSRGLGWFILNAAGDDGAFQLAQLLVQRVGVDAESGRGLDQHVVTHRHDLLQQLALHATYEPIVQLALARRQLL